MNMKSLLIFALLTGFSWPTLSTYAQSALQAGTAQVEITPPLGCPMWGYESRKEGANGVHDPLMAKVLILKSTETTVALVSWDVCEFQSPWLHQQMKPLGIDHLLLLCSHTHAGPFGAVSRRTSLEKTVEERILKAIRKRRPICSRLYRRWGRIHRWVTNACAAILTLVHHPVRQSERFPRGRRSYCRRDPCHRWAGFARCLSITAAAVVMGSTTKLSADYGGQYRRGENWGTRPLLFARAARASTSVHGARRGPPGRFQPVDKMGNFAKEESLRLNK